MVADVPAAAAPFDVCVVGAGPVGLTLALEAADAGLRVLVLEAGGRSRRRRSRPAGEDAGMRVLDTAVHAAPGVVTARGVGGTSWLWGGRCVPFEPEDFAARPGVPYSGWPLTHADVAPFEARAAAYLDCGSARFHGAPLPGWAGRSVRTDQCERLARRPRLGRSLGARAVSHPGITLLPGLLVTGLGLSADGRTVDHVVVRSGGREFRLSAASYAIACGGLATTRLLLGAQLRRPDLFGGAGGPLGRFYMGHLTGSIAAIVLNRPGDFAEFDFVRADDGVFVRRRFTLGARVKRTERLLSTSFFLGNLPFHDERHGSGALSLFYLLLSVPVLGARLLAPETWRRNAGPTPRRRGPHLRNIARRPLRLVRDVAGVVRLRYLSSLRRAVVVLPSDTGTYALRYHAEQVPSPASRVTADGTTAADGLPGIEIDFRYADQDVDSVLRAHALLDHELRESGYGRLEWDPSDVRRRAAIRAQASDGYHQIGTTRMSADPADGVVDADCRVHGVENLFIASSSVFPTSSEANPTFMAVTLAVRLAHHLARVAVGGS